MRESTMGQLKVWWRDRVNSVRDEEIFSSRSNTHTLKNSTSPNTQTENNTRFGQNYQAGISAENTMDSSFLSLLKKISKETFNFVVTPKDSGQKAQLSNQKQSSIKVNVGKEDASAHTSDLWREAEILLKAASWKYDVGAKAFLCTPNTYSLLQMSAQSEASDFYALLPYFADEDQSKLTDCWNSALYLKTEAAHTAQLKHSQKAVWLNLKFKPVSDGEKLISVIGTLEDVTEKVAEEEKLILEKKNAEEVTQAKNALMSLYSHEIRTPLNSIMGLTYLSLQDRHLGADHRRYLNSIHFSAKYLLSLCENSLDHSKIDAGKMELEVVDFQLKDLLHNLHQSFHATALEKQLNFELIVDNSVPEKVEGDPVRLAQVLHNLIGNALKFTNKGSVKVIVDVVYQSDNDFILEFAVEDTGIGIPEDSQQLIFERYKQALPSTRRQFGGTGLGLSITKEIVALHKGEIELSSKEGAGSVFKVRLKYNRAAAVSNQQPEEQQSSENCLNGLHVLVIDDDAINNLVTCELLHKWGATTDTAESGVLAMEKLKYTNYDLVLMDLYMPDMDGFATINEIRKAGQRVPVMALTGTANKEEIQRLMAMGVNDYLIKPFHPQQLCDKLIQINSLFNQKLSTV